MKYLLRTTLKLKQSTRMCLTVSGRGQVVHSGCRVRCGTGG